MSVMKCCIIWVRRGITLIELLIVLLIIAVVGMAIIGRMLSGIERARLLAAAKQVVSHIRLAQERAKLEQRNYTVEFDAENETYKIYQAGLSFDGVDDYVSISGITNFTTSFSVEAWVKTTDTGGRIVADDDNNAGWAISMGDPGSGRLRFFIRGKTTVSLDGTTAINNGNWHHVVAVYDSVNNSRYIYLDNNVEASLTSDTGTPTTDSGPISIGGETSASAEYPGTQLTALISEVRIYNRALTSQEIQYSYTYKKPMNRAGLVGWWRLDEGQGTTALDSSGYGNNGTISGATWSQGVIGYLKDPAKGYQDINYDFDNLPEFKGVAISTVDFDGTTITNSSKFSFNSAGRPIVGTENLSADGTVVLTCGNYTITIKVKKITGEVTME